MLSLQAMLINAINIQHLLEFQSYFHPTHTIFFLFPLLSVTDDAIIILLSVFIRVQAHIPRLMGDIFIPLDINSSFSFLLMETISTVFT